MYYLFFQNEKKCEFFSIFFALKNTFFSRSGAKYDSGSGWPSFSSALGESITNVVDQGHGMTRVEVRCSKVRFFIFFLMFFFIFGGFFF